MWFGTTFDDIHSYNDFGLRILQKTIGLPAKIKRLERVPHSNSIYDFSTIYGGQEYEERTLTYVYSIKPSNVVRITQDKARIDAMATEFVNNLMKHNEKQVLQDDVIPDYHFLAEVQKAPDLNELRLRSTLTVNYTCYPFRIADLEEGNDIWNTFNFLLDYAQITQFNIDEPTEITLWNPGITPLSPVVTSDTPMQIIKDGTAYDVPVGDNVINDFVLGVGENNMIVNGIGNISFHFKKELI
jgi:hypothetical protein